MKRREFFARSAKSAVGIAGIGTGVSAVASMSESGVDFALDDSPRVPIVEACEERLRRLRKDSAGYQKMLADAEGHWKRGS